MQRLTTLHANKGPNLATNYLSSAYAPLVLVKPRSKLKADVKLNAQSILTIKSPKIENKYVVC